MMRNDKQPQRRIALGRVSRSTRGNVRGTIETFGLYAPGVPFA
jgi:hypothetical protein